MTPATSPTASPQIGSASGAPALGFTTLEQESVIDELPVSGELPPWLAGSLLRTGPARFEVGPRQMRHWFDGLAMLHRFTIEGGGVSYGGRYLEGRSYRAAQEQRRDLLRGVRHRSVPLDLQARAEPVPPRGALTDNANVNVTRLGERFIAMTETPMPVQFDPHTLDTAGVLPFATPGELTTAHPHLDRDGGGMLNYAASLGARSSYRFFKVRPDSQEAEVIGSMPVRRARLHALLRPHRALPGAGRVPVRGQPAGPRPGAAARTSRTTAGSRERGTRFVLFDRSTGEVAGELRTEACFAFHHVNAFDDGDEVVVDLCAYPDPGIVEDLYLERLRAGKPLAKAELVRFRLDPRRGSVARERLAEE